MTKRPLSIHGRTLSLGGGVVWGGLVTMLGGIVVVLSCRLVPLGFWLVAMHYWLVAVWCSRRSVILLSTVCAMLYRPLARVISHHDGTLGRNVAHLLPWWRHDMGTVSALLAICVGNPPMIGGFPHKGLVMQCLMFSLLSTQKLLNKQSSCR